MTIAVNSTRFIKSTGNDLLYNYFIELAVSKPEHQFIFIIPPGISAQQDAVQNILHVVSSPAANNSLMWKIWLDYNLPAIARKHKADILINTGGICSLRTKIPQWLFISDLSFLYFPQYFQKKQLHFLKRNMPGYLNKANAIVTVSDFLKQEIIRLYSIGEKKIIPFQLTPGDHYQPVDWQEKEAIKEKYTEGKEYFLFSGEIHPQNNLVNLLKAFSFFKKRQKSNMQLIITSQTALANNVFIENLKTYKYRREVSLLTDLPEKELGKITSSAYAFIYPAVNDGMALFPLQAMQSGVPVITGNSGTLTGLAGDAVLTVDPADFEDIADKMMQLFKDETKRADLINKGKSVVCKIKKDKMDDRFWKSILKTIV